MKALEYLFVGFLCVYVAGVAIGQSKLDDSDNIDGTRSGMTPKTDYKTGCQYLQSPFGFALVPRMGVNGKQLGCKEST